MRQPQAVPVLLHGNALDRITKYSYITGKTLPEAVEEAINDFMDMTGDLIVSELRHRTEKRLARSKRKRLPKLKPLAPVIDFPNPRARKFGASRQEGTAATLAFAKAIPSEF